MSNIEHITDAFTIVFIAGCITAVVLALVHGYNIQKLPTSKLPAYVGVIGTIPDTLPEPPKLPSNLIIEMEVSKLPNTK